jgi:uncharacterized membrane protein
VKSVGAVALKKLLLDLVDVESDFLVVFAVFIVGLVAILAAIFLAGAEALVVAFLAEVGLALIDDNFVAVAEAFCGALAAGLALEVVAGFVALPSAESGCILTPDGKVVKDEEGVVVLALWAEDVGVCVF